MSCTQLIRMPSVFRCGKEMERKWKWKGNGKEMERERKCKGKTRQGKARHYSIF